jgi:VIT1/CCC1 family predicted Fe2+/Mn2+ transporter
MAIELENPHPEESHRSHRAGWLRAAVLGANDGIVSVSSLMLGVIAAQANGNTIIAAGFSGLAAGALSMAVGEYVSVSSQRDSEKEDIAIESRSIRNHSKAELDELTKIYEYRGLEPKLAREVANQLTRKDAVAAHVRDELGIDHEDLPNPVKASSASAIAFSLGAIIPILAAIVAGKSAGPWPIVIVSMIALAISGATGAVIGGGNRWLAALRVFIGGGAAMAITAFVGHLVGGSI